MLSIPVHTITIVKNIIFLSSILFLFFHAGAQAGDLLVTVEGIKSEQGNVRIALFNNAQGFPKNSIHGQFLPAKIGSLTFVFKNQASGLYVVSTFHDLNRNDKLDRNLLDSRQLLNLTETDS